MVITPSSNSLSAEQRERLAAIEKAGDILAEYVNGPTVEDLIDLADYILNGYGETEAPEDAIELQESVDRFDTVDLEHDFKSATEAPGASYIGSNVTP